jgi:hypothetical protein
LTSATWSAGCAARPSTADRSAVAAPGSGSGPLTFFEMSALGVLTDGPGGRILVHMTNPTTTPAELDNALYTLLNADPEALRRILEGYMEACNEEEVQATANYYRIVARGLAALHHAAGINWDRMY